MGDQGGHEGPQVAESAQPAAAPPRPLATQRDDDDDVVQAAAKEGARATDEPERAANMVDCDIPHKKRKTRRGKSKRRNPYYYKTGRKALKIVKPEAPHNSNQFLLEDHGDMQFLQEPLSHVGRTRDSSFSVESDNEFYSSPDDEDRYLIQDFFDQYESLQEEHLQSMTKDELIREHLILEQKMEQLNKCLKSKQRLADLKPPSPAQMPPPASSISPPYSNNTGGGSGTTGQLQREVDRLTVENEALKREIAMLRSNGNSRRSCTSSSSSSEDSETDSDDSCSSSTTSSNSVCSMSQHDDAPVTIDYSQTNGHAANSVETA